MDRGCDWPHVVKPRWIHDSLLLWRRKEPYELYLDQVTEYSVREMRDKMARRRCIVWFANHFSPSRAATTLTQNVWASYSHHYLPNQLAPAYLAHLISCEPLAQQVTATIQGQNTSGMAIGRSHFTQIQAASGALESFLRTLVQWEVLAADPRRGGYIAERRLNVEAQTFPLLVWTWWLGARKPSLSLEEFAQLPMWSWFDLACFEAGWQSYAGRLWTLEKDGGEAAFFLHPTDTAGFTRSLLNLLSTDGRRGRQLPRHGDKRDGFVDAVSLREGILGR
jgi:hypothetical protein